MAPSADLPQSEPPQAAREPTGSSAAAASESEPQPVVASTEPPPDSKPNPAAPSVPENSPVEPVTVSKDELRETATNAMTDRIKDLRQKKERGEQLTQDERNLVSAGDVMEVKSDDYSPDGIVFHTIKPMKVTIDGGKWEVLSIKSGTKDKFMCELKSADGRIISTQELSRLTVVEAQIFADGESIVRAFVDSQAQTAVVQEYVKNLGGSPIPGIDTQEGKELRKNIDEAKAEEAARPKENPIDKLTKEALKEVQARRRWREGRPTAQDKEKAREELDQAIAERDANGTTDERKEELAEIISRAEARAQGKLTDEERKEYEVKKEDDVYAETALRIALGIDKMPKELQGRGLIWYQREGLHFAGVDLSGFEDFETAADTVGAEFTRILDSLPLNAEQRALIKLNGMTKFILNGGMRDVPGANEKLGQLFFNRDGTPELWDELVNNTITPEERAAIEKMLKGKKIDTLSFLSLLYVLISEGAKPVLSVTGQ